MTQRMAIYMQDRIDIREELDLALYMEDRGFSEIWQGDNRLVRDIMAVSTAEDCRRKVRECVDAGVTCPIMYPLRGNIREVIDAFADGF